MAKTATRKKTDDPRREAVKLKQSDMFNTISKATVKALENDTVAIRLSTQGPTMRAGFKADDKSLVAEALEMSEARVRGGTQLVDTKHPAIEQVRNVIQSMKDVMNRYGLPFPAENAVRLLPIDLYETWSKKMEALMPKLVAANERLRRDYDEIKDAARRECGGSWRESSFPVDLSFYAVVDFPNVSPPDYLAEISPKLYQEAKATFNAQLKDATDRFETMLLAELHLILDTIVDKLRGEVNTGPLVKQCKAAGLSVDKIEGQTLKTAVIVWKDGATPSEDDVKTAQRFLDHFTWDVKPKVFRDPTILKIFDVIPRFRDLNINNNAKLGELVDQIEAAFKNQIPKGKEAKDLPQMLRDSGSARVAMEKSLSTLLSVVDEELQAKPARRVVRGGIDLETGQPI
jgi:hypothetical protein